jgi:mannose-6-phosphate isomerase-like protein (cupin superfamily)
MVRPRVRRIAFSDEPMPESKWLFSLRDVQEHLPSDPEVMRSHYALRHGTMKIGLYSPVDIDSQGTHKQDELYLVISGSGFFIKDNERRPISKDDVIFVEAGVKHRFVDFTDDFSTWVIFWGQEGGEV